jgi:cell division transport system permease protein
LAANAQVITVLRLIGAKDHYIAAAFVRRFTLRAFVGASVGVALAAVALFALPGAGDHVAVLSGLRFQGVEWIVLVAVPPVLALVSLLATRYAAMRVLEGLS